MYPIPTVQTRVFIGSSACLFSPPPPLPPPPDAGERHAPPPPQTRPFLHPLTFTGRQWTRSPQRHVQTIPGPTRVWTERQSRGAGTENIREWL